VQGRIGLPAIGADLRRHGPNPRSVLRIDFLPGVTHRGGGIAAQDVDLGQERIHCG